MILSLLCLLALMILFAKKPDENKVLYSNPVPSPEAKDVEIKAPENALEDILPTDLNLPPSSGPQINSPAPVIEAVPAKDSKFYFEPQIENSTGAGDVRKYTVSGEVGYQVSDQASLGVVASTEIKDEKDSAAWDKGTTNENTASVKYKVSF